MLRVSASVSKKSGHLGLVELAVFASVLLGSLVGSHLGGLLSSLLGSRGSLSLGCLGLSGSLLEERRECREGSGEFHWVNMGKNEDGRRVSCSMRGTEIAMILVEAVAGDTDKSMVLKVITPMNKRS